QTGCNQVAHRDVRPGDWFGRGDRCGFRRRLDGRNQVQSIQQRLGPDGCHDEAPELTLTRSVLSLRPSLSLHQMKEGIPESLLDDSSLSRVVLDRVHYSAPENRLPCRGEFVIQALASLFGRADHVGVKT